jgi:hypothetical protein
MPSDPLPAASEPNLDSFVLRFVRNGEPASGGESAQGAVASGAGAHSGGWHGVIRHVQSNRERAFSRWGDAVAFICQFVDVGENDDERG